MSREIYDEDREVTPQMEDYASSHGLAREFWLAGGKQGFLGLEIPELSKVNMTLPSWASTPTSSRPTSPT